MRGPPVRWRRYALALVAELAAAAGTWVWLDGPAWRSAAAAPGSQPHFSRDGRTLSTLHGNEVPAWEAFAPRVVRWDCATGRKLADVPITWEAPLPAPREWVALKFLPDDARVLATVLVSQPQPHYVYFVHDAATGRQLLGPVKSELRVLDASRDGRWFMARPDNRKGLAIVAAATGETVLVLGPGADAHAYSVAFAPDGSCVAVHWMPEHLPDAPAVVVHELPSGRELRRLQLPDRPWQRVNEWRDDGRLYVEVADPDPSSPPFYFCCSFSFSLADADFGAERPEPLLAGYGGFGGYRSYWDAGPGWVAHIELSAHRASPVDRAVGWLDHTFKSSLAPQPA